MGVRTKAKVNFANGLFWLSPQLSSYVRGQKYGYAPFKNLLSLVKQSRMEHLDILFSFNRLGEACYGFFNELWRIKGLRFRLSDENVKKIASQGSVQDDSLHPRVLVVWDERSLKSVRKGNIPFYSHEWYALNHAPSDPSKKAVVCWVKKEFQLLELVDLTPEEQAAIAEQEGLKPEAAGE